MSRIKAAFEACAARDEKALILYLTAGDPDLAATEELLLEMAARGVTLIELGVPFSDPMADGPIIQRASERALARGVKLADILDMVARVRRHSEVPIILFSYYNPILQFGLARLAERARAVGIDGILVTDLAPEEAGEFLGILRAQELEMIFLVAPTSSEARIAMVAKMASGFIYAVSRTGITGMQESLSQAVEPLIRRIKKVCPLPVAVGFGISNAEQVREIWQLADGAVVGSRIVAEIESCRQRDQLVARVGDLIAKLGGKNS
jgi:tryptophan synthase alpha chain